MPKRLNSCEFNYIESQLLAHASGWCEWDNSCPSPKMRRHDSRGEFDMPVSHVPTDYQPVLNSNVLLTHFEPSRNPHESAMRCLIEITGLTIRMTLRLNEPNNGRSAPQKGDV